MEDVRKKLEELGISEKAIDDVLLVAKRMDEKGLVNSFGKHFRKSRW